MLAKDGWRSEFARFARARVDGWANLLTGMTGTEDPLGIAQQTRVGYAFTANNRIADQTLEDLYHSDPIVARVCDVIPDEATRQGFEVVTDGDDDADVVADMHERLERMHVRAKLAEAWTWARLYGGGALLLGADDGRKMEEELDERNIRSLRFLTVLDRRECFAFQWHRDPLLPNFGEPELFRLARVTQGGTETAVVHASRLIRFHGVRTSRRQKMRNLSWSEGVVQRVWDAIRQYNGAWIAVCTLLQDASQGVFAIKDLAALMAEDSQDALKTRLQLMDMARSVARSILIDAENERFDRVESNVLTGLPEVLDRFMSNLSMATQIPRPILFGEAPAGLNATGDNTIRQFYDYVRSLQVNELQGKLERLIRLLWRAEDGPSGGREPPGWRIEFRPLWQATDAETADLRLKVAQADVAYIQAGVLTPEEVGVSRFRAEGWSMETVVDLTARIAAMEADKEPAEETPPDAKSPDPIATGAGQPPMFPPPEPKQGPVGVPGSAGPTPMDLAKDRRDVGLRFAATPREYVDRADGASGVAIVLPVPVDVGATFAREGGVPAGDLHVTLAYLGRVDAMATSDLERITSVVRAWAEFSSLAGTLGGIGRFASGLDLDPVYVPLDAPALDAERSRLVGMLTAEGYRPSELHGFAPHMTVAYVRSGDSLEATVAPPTRVVFDRVAVWSGDARTDIALGVRPAEVAVIVETAP